MTEEIHDFREDDPIPDIYNRYPEGYLLEFKGRLYKRHRYGHWVRCSDDRG